MGWWQNSGIIGTFSGKTLKIWNDICPYYQGHLLPRWNLTFHIVGLGLIPFATWLFKTGPKNIRKPRCLPRRQLWDIQICRQNRWALTWKPGLLHLGGPWRLVDLVDVYIFTHHHHHHHRDHGDSNTHDPGFSVGDQKGACTKTALQTRRGKPRIISLVSWKMCWPGMVRGLGWFQNKTVGTSKEAIPKWSNRKCDFSKLLFLSIYLNFSWCASFTKHCQNVGKAYMTY